jgi:hypothetical protein
MCPMTWLDEDHSDASGHSNWERLLSLRSHRELRDRRNRARRQHIRELVLAIAAICGLTAVLIVALQRFLEWAR